MKDKTKQVTKRTQNKRAFAEYEIIDKYEAGIVLKGAEAKSVRTHGLRITDSFVKIINDEPYLINSFVEKYEQMDKFEPIDIRRSRKLLLHSRELKKIIKQLAEKGYTCVPLNAYYKKQFVKVEIGVGKGKNIHDKRMSIRERDLDREMEREYKHKYR